MHKNGKLDLLCHTDTNGKYPPIYSKLKGRIQEIQSLGPLACSLGLPWTFHVSSHYIHPISSHMICGYIILHANLRRLQSE